MHVFIAPILWDPREALLRGVRNEFGRTDELGAEIVYFCAIQNTNQLFSP